MITSYADTRVSIDLMITKDPVSDLITKMLNDRIYGGNVIQVIGILTKYRNRSLTAKAVSVSLWRLYRTELTPHRLVFLLKELADLGIISWDRVEKSRKIVNRFYVADANRPALNKILKIPVPNHLSP